MSKFKNQSADSIVRELYAHVGAGRFEAVLALLAEDVEFVQAATLPCGGTYRGHAGFQEMAGKIIAAWPGFTVKAKHFLSDGLDTVVVTTQLTGQGLDMPMLELWTVIQGKVARCQPFYFDTKIAAQGAVR